MRKTHTTITIASALMLAPGRQWGRSLSASTGIPSGSLHPVLARMRAAGWLSDGWEDLALARAEGRPPRRYYEVTPVGAEALGAMLASVRADPRFRSPQVSGQEPYAADTGVPAGPEPPVPAVVLSPAVPEPAGLEPGDAESVVPECRHPAEAVSNGQCTRCGEWL